MRILVLSDLHANPAALAVVTEPFDICLCLGDLVEYGPQPAPCVDWIRQHDAITVRGNHDHGAVQGVETIGVSGFRYLTMATRQLTRDLLSAEQKHFLSQLPTTRMLRLDGKRFFMAHASPRDPMDEYMTPNPNSWKSRIEHLNVDFVCVGHTHIQYVLEVNGTTILNPGSLGLQRNGDPRAHYAIIDHGEIELYQKDYNIQEIVEEVDASPLDTLAKQILKDIYWQGRYVHPDHLPLPIPNHHRHGKSHGNGYHPPEQPL